MDALLFNRPADWEESSTIVLSQFAAVLITAHGISHRERLMDAGKPLIDTTCPLVRRVHEAAQRLERDGFHVLLIGRPGHVEVRGIIEDLSHDDVIASAEKRRGFWPAAICGLVARCGNIPNAISRPWCSFKAVAGVRLFTHGKPTVCLR